MSNRKSELETLRADLKARLSKYEAHQHSLREVRRRLNPYHSP